ncbi:MAG: type II toxin-antitoxin system VapC family toxin [Verrucomicrobiaceae bacterium]|nr:type II toxin-antitoxin system VapC family toxin [Verrucomicrobiaceae bacterium]
MNVIDSSAWLEYFADTDRADFFADAIEDSDHLIVPSICLYEVFKKVLRERGEDAAIRIISVMSFGRIVDLDASLALEAARHSLPLADSIIYSTALRFGATLWTQDSHFEHISGVRYFPK